MVTGEAIAAGAGAVAVLVAELDMVALVVVELFSSGLSSSSLWTSFHGQRATDDALHRVVVTTHWQPLLQRAQREVLALPQTPERLYAHRVRGIERKQNRSQKLRQ